MCVYGWIAGCIICPGNHISAGGIRIYPRTFPRIRGSGGVNLENAMKLKHADILSSASTILEAEDPNLIIELLKESDKNAK